MGFMTEMSMLNDDWHRIRESIIKDPEAFCREIDVLMNGRAQYGLQGEDGRREYLGSLESDRVKGHLYFEVYRSHHADDARTYVAYGNCFQVINKWLIDRTRRRENFEFLERMAKIAKQDADELLKYIKEKRKEVDDGTD